MFCFESLRRIAGIRLPHLLFVLPLLWLCLPTQLEAQRMQLPMRTPGMENVAAVDAGPVPGSEPLQITVRLALGADRSSALDSLLIDQVNPASASYHQWLTPQQFGDQFGASEDQIASVMVWLESQGLVGSVSPAKTRITVSGTAAQVESAFAVTLRRYQVAGVLHFANATQPAVPQALAGIIAGVSGLSDLPGASSTTVATVGSSGAAAVTGPSTVADPLMIAASVIDTNAAPIVTFTTDGCSSDYLQSDYDAYHDLLRQANAQGITVLSTSGCGTRGTGSFPASLAETTAVTVTPVDAPFTAIAARPGWQSAPGLPADQDRHETDLTASSFSAFAQTIQTIVQQNKARQGNINATLYALAPTEGLYAQPDARSAAGTWEPSTGLGVVNLTTLLKVYPRSTGGTSTSISTPFSSNQTPSYGQPFTLSATVTPSSIVNYTPPTGSVTFTTAQGVTIGSTSLNNGTATLNVSWLSVGTYAVYASYSGDSNYAASSSADSTGITVSIVNAVLVATVSPATNVPYGATATVTATVSLPGSSVSPGGTVSAQVEGIGGTSSTATLSPNPGGNSATANITISAPPPGSSTVQVTCAGNQNFQCQTPVNIPFTSVKGNTQISVTAVPSAPQAGEPVILTATVANSGNGSGAYTFTGSITFFDNGKFLASAPVANNQATTTQPLYGAVTHTITASYSGDMNWNGNTSSAQAVTPTLVPTTLTLSSNVGSLSAALAGTYTVLTATIFNPSAGSIGPTGTVSFFNVYNGTVVPLGVSTLASNGANQSIAVFSTTGFPAGSDNVYAVYAGDANFSTATSSSLVLTFSDYSVTMVPQTLTLSSGQTGQVTMLAGPISGFSGSITFSCTPPVDTETSCSFSPASLTGGGTTTMTIVTTGPVSGVSTAMVDRKSGRWNMVAGTSLAALFCMVVPRRRRLPTLLLLFCSASLTASLGCGQLLANNQATTSPNTPSYDPGTPQGTRIFTVTTAGSDGVSTVRHIYQYQVTVQ